MRRSLVPLWLAIALIAGAPPPVAAQVQDSLEVRILESLRRLDRAPAPDTATIPDTVAAVTLPRRPAARTSTRPSSGDSVSAALLELTGYEATQYQGLAAEFDAQGGILVLHGDSARRATLITQGNELTADSVIVYDEGEGTVRGLGTPVFTPAQGDPVSSSQIVFDLEQGRGSAFDARTRYSEGASWYVTGDLPSVSQDLVYGSETHFTSCDLEVPHYHFAADEVKIVAGRILVARPVKLYFGDVPVAWLPFIAQSLATGRASGILTPRFSINDIVRTSGGYRRRVSNVGFYWALSEYADATVALDWFSDNFTSVTGAIRYAWSRQFLNGGVNVRRYWPSEGGSQLAFDTDHSWRMDERTNFRLSARYSSSTDFIRRNSFDPREVTQSINSTGGFDRRFDWGNISLSGNRDEYLSDDRIEMTLPQLQLNLSTITLFRAPSARAHWWNNLTWSGGAGGLRRTVDRTPVLGEPLRAADADLENVSGQVRSAFNLGNLSWSQSARLEQASVFDVPLRIVAPAALGFSPTGRVLLAPADAAFADGETLGDVTRTELSWQTAVGYQQRLVGSTTVTPSLTLSGNARRSDTLTAALNQFVSGPARLTFGATLKSDVFGFFPGVGPFEAIRHKLSPEFQFNYAPEPTSTPLQETVFGRLAIQPRKELSFTLSQTFEAKRKQTDTAAAEPARTRADEPRALTDALTDTLGGALATRPSARRQDIVTLLALRTSAVQYDFFEADTLGDVLFGFKTTQITNQISSDFLRGLSISMSHDLFAESTVELPGGGVQQIRNFDLHLSSLNFGFSLDNRSALVRAFGLFGGDEEADSVATEPLPGDEEEPEDPFRQASTATDESTIIPGTDRRGPEDPRDEQRWDPLESTCRHASLSIL